MAHPSFELPEILSTQDVASIVVVTPKTVRCWIRDKKLKAIEIGRVIRITRKNFEDFLRRHR